MLWPAVAVAGPDFTTVIAGCFGVRWWWSSSQTLTDSGSVPQAVTVLSTLVDGLGTVKSLVRVVEAPISRELMVPTLAGVSSRAGTLVRATSPVLVTCKL